MGTSAGFVPAAVPECAYAPRMTRAQAIALRTAGALQENCVVVITDGPVIGTAGNTSPTEIELNPVSSTDLGTTARVHTTFSASAMSGVYRIDLGTGTITELRDGSGNVAKDTDAGSPTVTTQVPWHLSGANFRDNYFEDSTLTGFAGAVGAFTNNRVVEATLDFTGKTAGAINQCEFIGGTATVAGSFTGTRARFNNCTITKAGTGAFTFSDAAIEKSTINQVAGGAAPLSVSDSRLDPSSAITLAATSLASGNVTLFSGCSGRFGIVQNGGGLLTLALVQGAWTVIGAAAALRNTAITRCGGVGGTVNQNGTLAGGTGDNVLGNMISGDAVLNLNCTDAVARTYTKMELDSGAVVNMVDPGAAPNSIVGVVAQSVSTLNVQAGGAVSRMRLSSGAIVNTGAFVHQDVTVDGPFTKTLTAANVNRLCNKSYDDIV